MGMSGLLIELWGFVGMNKNVRIFILDPATFMGVYRLTDISTRGPLQFTCWANAK